MNVEGFTADQILAIAPIQGCSRHILAAKAWLDNARRTDNPAAITYAAIELRYGIEYLLAECLVLSGFMTEERYSKSLGNPTAMKKMLGDSGVKYEKLCDFYEALDAIEKLPPSRRWSIGALFKSWGTASHYLHWCGSHHRSHDNKAWRVEAIAGIDGASAEIWAALTTTAGSALMRPDGMMPAIRSVWDDFAAGKLDLERVRIRLRLLPWP